MEINFDEEETLEEINNDPEEQRNEEDKNYTFYQKILYFKCILDSKM